MASKVQERDNTREDKEERLLEKAKLELALLWEKFTNSTIGTLSYHEIGHLDLKVLINVSKNKRREYGIEKKKIDGFIEGFNRWERRYKNLVILEGAKKG